MLACPPSAAARTQAASSATSALKAPTSSPTPGSNAPTAASRQEHDDYRAAAAQTSADALEKSARDFASKYPSSSLRVYLFERALRRYQIENDAAGIEKTAQEILAIDPANPLALVLAAMIEVDGLTSRASSADQPDRDRRVSEIRKSAEQAIRGLDRGVLPRSATPEQAGLYRSTLKAMAYSALGIMKLKTGDDAGAERDLKTATELGKVRPDPAIWYHLALAQDHRKKYSAAINSVEQAMQLASANPQLQRLAEMEHERLYRLAGRNPDSAPSGSDGGQPPERIW